MKNWKLIIGMLTIFALGVVTGVLGVRIIAHRAMDRVVEGGPDVVNRMIVKRLTWDLKLTDEQRDKVQKIVKEAQRELGDVRKESQPRVARELGQAALKIRSLLDEEQREKFDKRIAEGREKLERFEQTRGAIEETAVLPGG